jgi:hypothetical protein
MSLNLLTPSQHSLCVVYEFVVFVYAEERQINVHVLVTSRQKKNTYSGEFFSTDLQGS